MKSFPIILGAVAAVGVGLLAWQLTSDPVSIPANVAVLPADTAGFRGYVLGSDSAPVEIVEYADYQCPFCADFDIVQFPDVKSRLIDSGKVRYIYRDFPLDHIHQHARLSAHAAACADDQGKFWPMHNLIYQGQPDWVRGNAEKLMRGYAELVELDLSQYNECMQSAKHAGRIEASLQEGNRLGVNSTPTLFIGGRLYPNLRFDKIRELVDSIIEARPS